MHKTPSLAGATSYNSGTFTVSASGTDIWGTADQFHYVYRPFTGDGSFIVRVDSLQNTHGWAKAGVMVRETLAAGPKHAMMIVTPGNGTSFQRRKTTNGTSLHTTPFNGVVCPRLGLAAAGRRHPDRLQLHRRRQLDPDRFGHSLYDRCSLIRNLY